MTSSQEVVHALCDEDKFHKHIDPSLLAVRGFAGDGLFTALQGERHWDIAHRILVPAFGSIAVRHMQGTMLDPLGQMLMWWECHAGEPFEVADQFTRLTFDTIALSSFGYRFNSFHSAGAHPFIGAMTRLLTEALMRPNCGFLQMFYAHTKQQWNEDTALLNRVCDEIIAERRQNPQSEAHDVLDRMLFGKDAKTGEGLSDENIRYQMITFLMAGHETTSGLLSFATYYMLKNPGAVDKMRAEIEQALADVGGAYDQLAVGKLRYVDAVLRETLRLNPSAPFFVRTPYAEEGELLPGGFHVKHEQAAVVSLHALHRDPDIFEAPDEFRPERWLDGTVYPADAYKPFGTGGRACIGRMFAMQEAALALSLIVERFDLSLADPAYELQIQESLTIKPVKLRIRAAPRRKLGLMRELMARGTQGKAEGEEACTPASRRGRMHVLFGSNNGSCETLASELASEYTRAGFAASLAALDRGAGDGRLPTDGPVVVILPSYDGQPADNAAQFVRALAGLEAGALAGVQYAVLGAGHRDWAATLHRVPRLVDARLAALGAERLLPLSLGDAGGDLLGDFEDFGARLRARLDLDVDGPEDTTAWSVPASANCAPADGFVLGRVVAQTTLLGGPEPVQSTTIEVAAPWRVGDYLAVVPKNAAADVERALRVLGLDADAHVRSPVAPGPLRARDVLESYVELGAPVGRRHLVALARWAPDSADSAGSAGSAARLAAMADDYAAVRRERVSLLDVLERFPDVRPPLGRVLAALPRMRARQYSIASAPAAPAPAPTLDLDLTYAVHARGAASRYLARLRAGDALLCAVRPSSFRPPPPHATLVMFAAGTGIAPFRGFIAERARAGARRSGRTGRTVLYYGARDGPAVLHDAELRAWVRAGVLELRLALSRAGASPHHPLRDGCRYVQDRVWAERAEVAAWLGAGAAFYTCGAPRLAAGVRACVARIIAERDGCSTDSADEAITQLGARFRTDVFAS